MEIVVSTYYQGTSSRQQPCSKRSQQIHTVYQDHPRLDRAVIEGDRVLIPTPSLS